MCYIELPFQVHFLGTSNDLFVIPVFSSLPLKDQTTMTNANHEKAMKEIELWNNTARSQEDPIEFWKKIDCPYPLMKNAALSAFRMKSSTASCEAMFSYLRYLQGTRCSSLKIEILQAYAIISTMKEH